MEYTSDALQLLISRISLRIRRLQFGNKSQLAFLEDLYLLINDGIPANRAVEMMAKISRGLTREVAISLSKKIAQGQPLAEGMRDWFSMNVIEIIRVGEEGGALAETMKSAINMLSQRSVSLGTFVGAVSYPLFVIVIACVVIIYLNNSVFVQFRLIKPIEQWPEAGQQLVLLATYIETWWWMLILFIIALVFGFRKLMTNYVGDLRATLDDFPPFSFYKRFVAARLLETLGLLIANGVVFKSAIKVIQHQSNPYLAYHLTLMEHLLSMGKTNIADVLATGLIDDADLMRLRVMAEVKGFEHGLTRMGIRGTEQATQTLKFISRAIGGFFLVIGGLLIILIIRGIYLTGMAMGS